MSDDDSYSTSHADKSTVEIFSDVLTLPSMVEPAAVSSSSPSAVISHESADVDVLSENNDELIVFQSAKRTREEDTPTCKDSESPPKKKLKEASVVEEQKDGESIVPKTKKELQEEERLKMQVLVSHFSEDQLNRYEMFRRAAFPKAAVKRLMQMVTGTSVSQNVVIAMSGIAKVYVGELVETALDVMEQWSETGPLQPKHLREAVRRIRLKNGAPSSKCRQRVFH